MFVLRSIAFFFVYILYHMKKKCCLTLIFLPIFMYKTFKKMKKKPVTFFINVMNLLKTCPDKTAGHSWLDS